MGISAVMGKDNELLAAARNGNVQIVKKLLTRGSLPSRLTLRRAADINCRDTNGETPLHTSALNRHLTVVELLLQCGAQANLTDSKGCYPLHLAAWNGSHDIAKALLTIGPSVSDINGKNMDGDTPLSMACQYGHTRVVKLLLQFKANPMLRNNKEESPLDLASLYGRLDTVSCLIESCPDLLEQGSLHHTPLHFAARNGHKDVVRALLQAGFKVNAKTTIGTALHEATLFGKQEVVRLLLSSGINIDETDGNNKTVLEHLRAHRSQTSNVTRQIVEEHILMEASKKAKVISMNAAEESGTRHAVVAPGQTAAAAGGVGDSTGLYDIPSTYSSKTAAAYSMHSSSTDGIYDIPSNLQQAGPSPIKSEMDLPMTRNVSISVTEESVEEDIYDCPRNLRPAQEHAISGRTSELSMLSASRVPSTKGVPCKPPRRRDEKTSLKLLRPGDCALPEPATSVPQSLSPGEYVQLRPALSDTWPRRDIAVAQKPQTTEENTATAASPPTPFLRVLHAPVLEMPPLRLQMVTSTPVAKDDKRSVPSGGFKFGHSKTNEGNVVLPIHSVQSSQKPGCKPPEAPIDVHKSEAANSHVDDTQKGQLGHAGSPSSNGNIGRTSSPTSSRLESTAKLQSDFCHSLGTLDTSNPFKGILIPGRRDTPGLSKGSTSCLVQRDSAIRDTRTPRQSQRARHPGAWRLSHPARSSAFISVLVADPLSRPRMTTTAAATAMSPAVADDDTAAEDNDYEEWKQIATVMSSYGGRLSVSLSLGDESDLGKLMEDMDNIKSVGEWLSGFGLAQYENTLVANGFDNTDFLGGHILEEVDLRSMGVTDPGHIADILSHSQLLKPVPQIGGTGVASLCMPSSVAEWLESLQLSQYIETFHEKSMSSMDRVLQLWELELSSILNITVRGHQKRILASLGENREGFSTLKLGKRRPPMLPVSEMDYPIGKNEDNRSHLSPPLSVMPEGVVGAIADHGCNSTASSVANDTLSCRAAAAPEAGGAGHTAADCAAAGAFGDNVPSQPFPHLVSHADVTVVASGRLPQHDCPGAPVSVSSPKLHLGELQVSQVHVPLNIGEGHEHRLISSAAFASRDGCLEPASVAPSAVMLQPKEPIRNFFGAQPAKEEIRELGDVAHPPAASSSSSSVRAISDDSSASFSMPKRSPASQRQAELTMMDGGELSKCSPPGGAGAGEVAQSSYSTCVPELSSLKQASNKLLVSDTQNGDCTGNPPEVSSKSSSANSYVSDRLEEWRWRHKPELLIKGCVNYDVMYLGTSAMSKTDGIEATHEAIDSIKAATASHPKSPTVTLSISYKGVKFINASSKEVVCEHDVGNIYCVSQHAEAMNFFAYSTKDHLSRKLYCHIFCVKSVELAREIILTLGEAFEVAYYATLKSSLDVPEGSSSNG